MTDRSNCARLSGNSQRRVQLQHTHTHTERCLVSSVSAVSTVFRVVSCVRHVASSPAPLIAL